jgi:hypothetical protein
MFLCMSDCQISYKTNNYPVYNKKEENKSQLIEKYKTKNKNKLYINDTLKRISIIVMMVMMMMMMIK